jgi:putative membrane protein
MQNLIYAFVVMIALLHLYFLILEMFFWTKPLGLKAFRQTVEKAQGSAVLAANQGLYNGFLAAGLIWGVFHPSPIFSIQIIIFFLSCVLIAGIYGGKTVSKKIFLIQGMPAAIALIMLLVFISK